MKFSFSTEQNEGTKHALNVGNFHAGKVIFAENLVAGTSATDGLGLGRESGCSCCERVDSIRPSRNMKVVEPLHMRKKGDEVRLQAFVC
jgi:hypothetical protein